MKPSPEMQMAVFDAARQIADPAQREAWLAWVFRDLPEEATAMRDLLAADAGADAWFDKAQQSQSRLAEEIAHGPDRPDLTDLLQSPDAGAGQPDLIASRYQVLRRLGGGSGGVVFLASQSSPIQRTVALKILHAGMETPAFLAAFERERQVLALMNHPNIAGILDAGTTGTGQPYLVMELVEGQRITQYCDARNCSILARLALFQQVGAAIQHAHQKGIIHRDLKPSNILVDVSDAQPRPKVIDFGIALMAMDDGAAPRLYAGTPPYMSPEQSGRPLSGVDTRTDVFSLGVLLYELLLGLLPWAPGAPPAEGAPPPSAVLAGLPSLTAAAIAEKRHISVPHLIKTLKGDLDAIVLKAMSADPAHRYATANSLLMDLQRHLTHHPALAHPASRSYLLSKFVRRHRRTVAAIGVAATALVLGAGFSFHAWLGEKDALDRAGIAHAKEAAMHQKVQDRENLARAAILLSQNQVKEADQLLQRTPLTLFTPTLETSNALRFLGERNAMLGRWPQASDCFLRLMEANALVPALAVALSKDLLLVAPCLLENGDAAGYERMRRDMLARLPATDHQIAAEHLLKICLLRPADGTILTPLEPMARLLEKHLASSSPPRPESPSPGWSNQTSWNNMALALYHYRRGDHAAALQLCRSGLQRPDARTSRTSALRLIAAMALQHLQQPEEARREYKKAAAVIQAAASSIVVDDPDKFDAGSETWYAWSVARLLQREASPLMGSPTTNTSVLPGR
jgi:serine/threonine protein kinase/tetratricopeptide (TPR) repeat protein